MDYSCVVPAEVLLYSDTSQCTLNWMVQHLILEMEMPLCSLTADGALNNCLRCRVQICS